MTAKLCAASGHQEIRCAQLLYNKKIESAPSRPGWNRMTSSPVESKRQLETAKFNAIKSIVQDYAIFNINLLSDEALEAMKPKTESVGDAYKNELRG